MPLAVSTAARAVSGICALFALVALTGCEGAFGESPPHAAPSSPFAEASDGQVELSWGAVTDADGYMILWTDSTEPGAPFSNVINDITGTTYVHTGLVNLRTYRYRIVAQTGGGRGPESITVSATPGPVPGPIEWTVVTAENPGNSIHFSPATLATGYRIYFASTETALAGRRPFALFEAATTSPAVRATIPLTLPLFYRVFAMNDERIGVGGPVAMSPTHAVTTHDLPRTGLAFGDPNDDDCLDLPTAAGMVNATACTAGFTARVLAEAGLADLFAAGRTSGDSRFADFSGDRRDDLFSNTLSLADDTASIALLHVNQGTGNYQTSAGVSALGIGGFGGTVLAADLDNDGDLDLFVPNDHTRGDGARNWLLRNGGGGVFTDIAVAAGVDTNPAGAAYVPRGGQAVDFNEDGFVDLLFGSRLLINDGDGSFSDGSAAAGIPVLADQGLKLIDVDADGDLDLVHHDGSVTRLHLNTAGVFAAGTIVSESALPSFGFGLNACDLNNDGFEDVLIADNVTATGTGVPKLLINVAGTLMPSGVQREVTAGSNDLVAHNDLIACGDMDNNSTLDIVARWGTNYRLLRGALALTKRIRIRVLGAGGERNQQGRIVRIAPVDAPTRVMKRVIESGSGLHAQNQYDLIVGAPWTGEYSIAVRFASGTVTATAEPGDDLTIFADGRVVEGLQ
ncbi:MAG: FG-GAP-like repeat-containing protein [Steroidobacteraceae bacterium]